MSEFDMVIKGGMVIDGTGSPWLNRDIGITGGKIKKLDSIDHSECETIDATGMVVAPGFIDLHNHSDLSILSYPNAESTVMQGVTTAVVGNCGLSAAPLNLGKFDMVKTYISSVAGSVDFNWDWQTSGEYFRKVEKQGISLNLAPLVGQGMIRLAVKGFEASEASQLEMEEMKTLLAGSLEDGVFGLSTGLIYPPGSFTSTKELIELTSVLRKYGAIYTSHIRDEGDGLIKAVEEAIEIAEKNDIPVEISHHKAAGQRNWGKVNTTLEIMEQARKRGVEVNCDVYPYTAGSTSITSLLPVWCLSGGMAKLLDRLKSPKERNAIKKEMMTHSVCGLEDDSIWDSVSIAECPSRREIEGKSLKDILKNAYRFDDPYEGLFDFLLEIQFQATIILSLLNEDDVRAVIRHPLSSFISDSFATAPVAGGKPHPRLYGTFPRFLAKYVREEKVLTLEEAIRKMTSQPAGKIRLKGRGILQEGYWADIVIFDPAKIQDTATFENPHQYPEGISCVIVNGQVVIEKGQSFNARPGKVLRRE